MCNMSRPVAIGWHGVANATPKQQDASFLPLLGICTIFYCCFIFAPEILVELNLGLSFPAHTYDPFDCDKTKREISTQMLYHEISPGEFCHP